jgi:hypothetical protein
MSPSKKFPTGSLLPIVDRQMEYTTFSEWFKVLTGKCPASPALVRRELHFHLKASVEE